ncbi:ABC transporter permease [Pseudanabaena sp. FACHB-1998]|uniref:ABC transporter permease n=1 Tax=Pseudanabaena sp. FACHB-1998 TaxID=2692858 RepID=UPI001681BB52|nr:ABC transporter permease subunit [Pseudanabaena sp. FACHB-1998]MBD2179290.1 ABC transporter permease [Pseudanabaena sp. FACHB-1998]
MLSILALDKLPQKKLLVCLFAVIVVLLPLFYLPDPLVQNPDLRFLPMRLPFFLGTDNLGRDLASRLYFGFGRSLGLVALTMLTTLLIAIPAGLLAAKDRWAGSVLEVISGAIWSIPTFIVGLIVFIGLKGDLVEIKFAILGFFNWVPIYRSVRDITKQVQPSNYILFSRAMGMSEWNLYKNQILPNVLPFVFPIVLLNLVSLFEAELVLAFLGLSYPDPTPTLGGILRQGIAYLNTNMILYPSILLASTTFIVILQYQNIKDR